MTYISKYALLALLGHGATTANACGGPTPISTITGTCNYATFVANLAASCDETVILGANTTANEAFIDELCASDGPVAFVEITGSYQNDRRYFQGGSQLVDGGDWYMDAARLKRFATNVGDSSLISFPEYAARVKYNRENGRATAEEPNGYPANMNLFSSCELQTMMCCFTDDDTETTFAANGDPTYDVCRHELHDSPESNHIKEGWSVFPSPEAGTHCVGFTWMDDDDELLGNMMYDISYRNTANKGYLKGIPGAPMCGCVEHMPVVEDAACRTATKTGDITYMVYYNPDTGDFSASNVADITYADCGATLKEQVTADGKDLSDHLVGQGGCADDLESYLNEERFLVAGEHASKYILPDPVKWSPLVVGEGIYFQPPSMNAEEADTEFRALIDAGCSTDGVTRQCIIRRVCSSCQESHRDIYYKRLTPFRPFGLNATAGEVYLLDMFMNKWVKAGNDMSAGDFTLHSTYVDALEDDNAWLRCDYGTREGFPRNCGPTGLFSNNWNSYVRGGAYATDHGFYVELP